MGGIVFIGIICGVAIAAIPVFPIYFWLEERRRGRASDGTLRPMTVAASARVVALVLLGGIVLIGLILLFPLAPSWIRGK